MGISTGQIVEIMRTQSEITPEELASRFSVSERTVRTYIRRINDAMEPFARIALKYGSYRLTVIDAAAFDEWVQASSERQPHPSDRLPNSSQERIGYMIDDLISRDGWITKADLAELLCVSMSTVSHDLALVEERLAAYGLSIERKPHYGIRVVGDELAKRLCLVAVLTDSSLEGLRLKDMPGDRLAAEISESVDAALARDGVRVSSLARRNLLIHIAVAVARIKEGNYVPLDRTSIQEMAGSPELAAAQLIASKLEEAFDVSFPEDEVAYIAIHLAGKQTLSGDPGDVENAVIDDEAWGVVSKMVDIVEVTFQFGFQDNLELRMNLARHIVPLAYRLKFNMNLKNPMLSEIRKRYPLAWSMAVASSAPIVETYGGSLSDDEIGYIAMSFALALEQEGPRGRGKRIVVVCASGAGTARLLTQLYRRELGQWLESVETCDSSHVPHLDFSQIDYLFTTVPLPCRVPVPVRMVSAFLEGGEREQVRELLSGAAESSQMLGYFDRRLFFPRIPARDWRSALDWLCERREEFGGAGDRFRELVFDREERAPTTFGNQVAVPHPLEATSDRTLVSVGIMEAPVAWGGHQVQVIFLLSIARDERPGRELYDTLAALMVDPDAIAQIVRERTWEGLMSLLQRGG